MLTWYVIKQVLTYPWVVSLYMILDEYPYTYSCFTSPCSVTTYSTGKSVNKLYFTYLFKLSGIGNDVCCIHMSGIRHVDENRYCIYLFK